MSQVPSKLARFGKRNHNSRRGDSLKESHFASDNKGLEHSRAEDTVEGIDLESLLS